MVASAVDTRMWNLGVPLGLLAVGCGRTALLEEGSDSVADSITESSPTGPTTTPGGCDPTCPPGYQCLDGICQYYGCLDFCCYEYDPCCYDPCCGDPCCGDPCCYGDGGNYCGYCSGHSDCGDGEYCSQYGGCYYAPTLRPCGETVQFVDAIPMPPMVDGAAVSLAFMNINNDAGRDLLVATNFGVTSVHGPNAALPAMLPFSGGGMVAVGDLDADGDDDVVRAGQTEIEVVLGEPGVGLQLAWSSAAPTSAAAVVASDIDADGDADVVVAGSPVQTGYADQWQFMSLGGGILARPILLDSFLDTGALAAGRYGGGVDTFVAAHEPSVLVVRFSPFGDVYSTWDGFRYGELDGLAAPDLFGDGFHDVVSAGAFQGWTLWSIVHDAMYFGNVFKLPGELQLLTAGPIAGDGADDLVFSAGAYVVIVHGGLDGYACTSEYEMPHDVFVAAIGDHTGDGVSDLAISDGTQTTIMVAGP